MKKELPEFLNIALSDIVTQYLLEYGLNDQLSILRFSYFAESVVSSIHEGFEIALSEEFNNIEFIENFLFKRKTLIKNNIAFYKELEHLKEFNIPDYVIDAIITSIHKQYKEFDKNDFHDFENDNFYLLFGENIALDVRNYLQMNQINKNKS